MSLIVIQKPTMHTLSHTMSYSCVHTYSHIAGLLTVAVSEEAITVDRSPPLAGTVNDGGEVGIDVDYTDSTNQLCVNWEGFSDPESGISSIHWAIGEIFSFEILTH